MSIEVLVPVGTQKGEVIAIGGVPHVICDGDKAGCIENQFRPRTYVDAAGNPVDDKCDAAGVMLHASPVCGCEEICLLVPSALADAVNAITDGTYTPVYTDAYANDASALPPVAAAGAVYVGYAPPPGCSGSALGWDSIGSEAPAGFGYIQVVVASPHDALNA